MLSHGASLSTMFTPDYMATALGFAMGVGSSRWAVLGATEPNENPMTYADLNFPATGTNVRIERDYYSANCDAVLDFFDVRLYMNHNAHWELHIGNVEWRLNGELLGAWPGLTLSSTMTPTPMSIPLMPGGMNVAAFGKVTFGMPTGIVLPSVSHGTMSSTGYLGFRFMVDGAWHSPPIAFRDPVDLSGGKYPLSGILSGTSMWEGVITCNNEEYWDWVYTGTVGSYDTYSNDRRVVDSNVSGFIVPNYPKGVARMNDDYAMVVFRGGFPATKSQAKVNDFMIDSRHEEVQTQDVYPAHSQFLATVQNDPHVIEEPMTLPTWSFSNLSGIYKDITYHNATVAPAGSTQYPWIGGSRPPGFEYSYTFRKDGRSSFVYPSSITPNQTLGYLSHFDPTVVYMNTWANPHWSYLVWFPPEGAPDATQWKIDGAAVKAQEYWLNARQQFIDHPALPSGERLKYRNHIVTEPLAQNGLAGLMEGQVFGQFSSWWGISRFQAQPVEFGANVALDARSAPAWSSPDGTVTVDAGGARLTPAAGAAKASLFLDVGRFGEHPYMLPHTADEVSVGWSGANVVSAKASQVGADGSVAELATAPGRFDKARGTSKKYAGTWRQDFGAGYLDDTGVDLHRPTSQSMSNAIMANAERVFAFGLLPARGFDRLRFDFTLNPEGSPAPLTVSHPVFHHTVSGANLALIRESAMFASVFTPNGPWWRWGAWSFYAPGAGFLNPPAVATASGMPTVLDALAAKRIAFLGKGPFEDLTAEVQAMYDEGIEWTQVKHLAADPFNEAPVTHSFLLKGQSKLVIANVNSYSEVPPLGGWPHRGRNGDYAVSAGPTQTAYSLASTKQWVIHPGEAEEPVNRLLKPPVSPENNVLTTAPVVPGYLGGWQREVLDGSEAIQWRVRLGVAGTDIDFARVRPWHGYVWVWGAGRAGFPLALLSRGDGRLFRLTGDDDETAFGVASAPAHASWEDKPVYEQATDGALSRAVGEEVASLLVVDGEALLQVVADEGNTEFDAMISDGPATAGTLVSHGDGAIGVYRVDGGTLKVTLRNASDLSLVSGPTDTNITGLSDEARIAVQAVAFENNQPGFILLVASGESTSAYSSTNGIQFT
jgi:hypothetical protein